MILTKIKSRIILINELYSKPADKLVTLRRKRSCTKCCHMEATAVYLLSCVCYESATSSFAASAVNCLFRYSRTKAVRHRVNYKYSFRTDQLDRFCFPPWPFPAGCDPHLGGLLAALTTVKTKNIRTIAHIVFCLKRNTRGNHQEDTKQQFCTPQ